MSKIQELVTLWEELIELTSLDEGSAQSFRARAYENALDQIKEVGEELAEMKPSQLTKLEGVGKSTAEKIREFFDAGIISKLEKLRKKYPKEFVALVGIPGLGPKTLKRLRDECGVVDLATLKKALDQKKLRDLKGLGEKTEIKIAEAIQRMGSKQNRQPIEKVKPIAEDWVKKLSARSDVKKAVYCGSLRRERETIADIDIVVSANEGADIMDFVAHHKEVESVLGHGTTKTSVVLKKGIQLDLRVVDPEVFGAATLYFTGSKAHNIKLRQLAISKGWTLNEYGLKNLANSKIIAAKTEKEIYEALGMGFVEPSQREH